MTGNEVPNMQPGQSKQEWGREMFLRDWEVGVNSIEKKGLDADKAAVDYSLAGIKSAFILNGGAFIALPALVNSFNICFENSRDEILFSASCFALGLIFAIATTYMSYFTMCYAGLMHFHVRESTALSLIGLYYGQNENEAQHLKKRQDAVDGAAVARKKHIIMRNIAIACGLGTGGAFITGTVVLLKVAWG